MMRKHLGTRHALPGHLQLTVPGPAQTGSQSLTCDLGDAFQPRHRQQDNNTLVGAHPEQTLADQEAGDTQVLLACGERSQREPHSLPQGRQWVLGASRWGNGSSCETGRKLDGAVVGTWAWEADLAGSPS